MAPEQTLVLAQLSSGWVQVALMGVSMVVATVLWCAGLGWWLGCFTTNLRRDQRDLERRLDAYAASLARPDYSAPSLAPDASTPTPEVPAEVVPIRDDYREPSPAEERRRKPGTIGDLYRSREEHQRAELTHHQRTRKATQRKAAPALAEQIRLPLEQPDELAG